ALGLVHERGRDEDAAALSLAQLVAAHGVAVEHGRSDHRATEDRGAAPEAVAGDAAVDAVRAEGGSGDCEGRVEHGCATAVTAAAAAITGNVLRERGVRHARVAVGVETAAFAGAVPAVAGRVE